MRHALELPAMHEVMSAALITIAGRHTACTRARLGLHLHGHGDTPAWARYGLPYALQPLPGDRALLVNRDYKPVGIGIPYAWYVDYECFPAWHLSGPVLARVRDADAWAYVEGIYVMYHDAPWRGPRALTAYCARLSALVSALRPRDGDHVDGRQRDAATEVLPNHHPEAQRSALTPSRSFYTEA